MLTRARIALGRWFAFFSLIFFSAHAWADATTYRVQEGDCLVVIMKKLGLRPLYGKTGKLKATIAANPSLQASNGNLIFPGDEIVFPVEVSQASHETAKRDIANEPSDKAEAAPIATPTVAAVEPPSAASALLPPAAVAPIQPDESSSELSVSTGVLYRRLDAFDSSNASHGYMSSDADPTLSVAWRPQLNKNFGFDFGMQYERANIEQAATRNFLSRQQTLTNFHLLATFNFFESWHFSVGGGSSQTLLYRAVSATDLQIDRIFINEFIMGLRYTIYDRPRLKLNVGVSLAAGDAVKNDSYDGEAGSAFMFDFQAEHRLSNMAIVGRAFSGERENNIQTVQFRMRESGVELGLKWNFSPDK